VFIESSVWCIWRVATVMTRITEPHGRTRKQTKFQLKNPSSAVCWINKSKFTFSEDEVYDAHVPFSHESQVSLPVHLMRKIVIWIDFYRMVGSLSFCWPRWQACFPLKRKASTSKIKSTKRVSFNLQSGTHHFIIWNEPILFVSATCLPVDLAHIRHISYRSRSTDLQISKSWIYDLIIMLAAFQALN